MTFNSSNAFPDAPLLYDDSLPRPPPHNESTSPPHLYNSFLYLDFYRCSSPVGSAAVFTSFTCVSFLLVLPLNVLVLLVGFQQWRKEQRRRRSNMNHSDFLTYNTLAMEMVGLLALAYYCYGMFSKQEKLMGTGVYIVFVAYEGRLLFQCLTCVKHYLAVIHPVTFLWLKTERGVRIRNASIFCIWLLSLGMLVLLVKFRPSLFTIPFYIMHAFGLLVISFCSRSVLLALAHRGPGEATGERKRVDQTKKRAFLYIVTISGVLLLKYVGLLVCMALHASPLLDPLDGCVVLMSSFWFCLPSSIATPLLFLNKAGKLQSFTCKAE